MCGRYSLSYDDKIKDRLNQLEAWDWLIEQLGLTDSDYNIPKEFKPTNKAPVILRNEYGKPELHLMKWGFKETVKNISTGKETLKDIFNSKIENINRVPYWREAFEQRRCLVPVSNWYEWHDDGSGKKKYSLGLKEFSLFYFPGIWRYSINLKTGEAIEEFSIITTVANDLVRSVHEKGRMPAILTDDNKLDSWLDISSNLKEMKSLGVEKYKDELMWLKEAV